MGTGHFSPTRLKTWLLGLGERGGAWGIVAYLTAFSLGELLQLPGFVFVSTAILVYGKLAGGVLAYVGSTLASTTMFLFVRMFRKPQPAPYVHPKLQSILNRLEQKPIQTVAWIRILLWFLPGTNLAMALTPLPLRYFILGSLMGYAPFMLAVVLLADMIFRIFGIA